MSNNDGLPSIDNQEAGGGENPKDPFHQYDNIMEQNIDFNDNTIFMNEEENPQSNYILRTQDLQEKQQILKYSVAQHQETIKSLFMKLYNQKKKLLHLTTQQFNKRKIRVDIGLEEELQEMRKKISNQQAKIVKLKNDIEMQGLAGSVNERNVIMLRQKREEIENEIESGRRFAATQYVRDYLERTYIHKVSYEDVKYEYEMKSKLKEYLKTQKELYEKKKDELKKAIEKEGIIKKQLEEEKSRLEAQLLPKSK